MTAPALLVWGATAVVSALGVAAVLRWARRALLDTPNARSSHSIPTPRGGGLGLWIGMLAGLGVWRLLGADAVPMPPVIAIAVVGIVTLISFLDDLASLSFRLRLLVHVVATAMMLWILGPYELARIPLLGLYWAPLSGLLLSVLWCVGLTNAYNFLDGIDGIAATQGLVGGIAWAVIGHTIGNPTLLLLGGMIAAACLAFLPFNWSPAKIFLGDVGSATLGMLFATLPLLAGGGGRPPVWAPVAGVLVVWPFLFDATFTFARRLAHGENVFQAHRSHLYQRLVIAGWSHARTATLYGGAAALCGAAAVGFAAGGPVGEAAAWIAAAAVALGLPALTLRAERHAALRVSSDLSSISEAVPSGH